MRRLAGDLGIAPNTVARAYRELEADGVLEGRGRAGTFVRATVIDGEFAPRCVRTCRCPEVCRGNPLPRPGPGRGVGFGATGAGDKSLKTRCRHRPSETLMCSPGGAA